jgi:UDP-N-acetylmuramoylalanine--D-glutamate ligase
VGVDDPWCQRVCTELVAANHRTIWPISSGRAMGRGVYALSGVLYDGTADRVVEVADLSHAQALIGRHNWQNAAAAYAVARSLGVPWEVVVEGLLTFPGLAHRMETVAQIGGVRFVNDSKATNAEAARQAMAAFNRFHWIAGGRPKSGGIDVLSDLYPRVAKAYLIGEAAPEFARALDGKADYRCPATSRRRWPRPTPTPRARPGGGGAAVARLRQLSTSSRTSKRAARPSAPPWPR